MTKNIVKELDAIILSSTYNEEPNNIIEFAHHLCVVCDDIKEKYYIRPVIVFENEEHEKFDYIKSVIKKKGLDNKIVLLLNISSVGFSACLNFGIVNTSSKYIFRIDTDDIIFSNRILNQLDLMISKRLDLVSSYMRDQDGRILKYPRNLIPLLLHTFMGMNPIAHPSICIRRSILNINYDEDLNRCEDFDLWIKLFIQNDLRWECVDTALTLYNTNRSNTKDKSNASQQIKIRIKYSFRFFIGSIILFLGIIPNFLRLLIPKNILLFIRRRI